METSQKDKKDIKSELILPCVTASHNLLGG